jgi:hypothetical protein
MLARTLALMLLLMFLVGNLGHASVITYQGSVTFTTVGSEQIPLPQFNPTLGYLTGVTVNIYGTGREWFGCDTGGGNLFWYQGAPFWPVMTPHLDHAFSVTGPGINSANDIDWSGESQTVMYSWYWPMDWNGTVGWGETLVDSSQSHEFAAYTGTGSIPFTVSASTMQASFIRDPRIIDAQYEAYLASRRVYEWFEDPSLAVRLSVNYQYQTEPVPEPTSMALAGCGFFALCWRVRRRRSRTL